MRFSFRGRRGSPVYNAELGHVIRELSPMKANAATSFISIPSMDIPALAEKYVAAMETEESADWCRCEWVIHPDDTEVKQGTCRECGTKRNSGMHRTLEGQDNEETHAFKGKRMRRGDEAPDCPVHTRAGLVIYFFEWVFLNAEKD